MLNISRASLGTLFIAALIGSGTAASFASVSSAERFATAPSNVRVVPFTPPTQTPPALVAALSQAAALAEDNPGAYEGSYFDRASGRVVLKATRAASQVPAQAAMLSSNPVIVIETAPRSRADAESQFGDFLSTNHLTDRVSSWWVDPTNDGFQVLFSGQPSSADLSSFASAPGAVTLVPDMTDGGTATDAQSDSSPVAGGSRYFAGFTGPPPLVATLHHRCSAGFGYKVGGSDYILTAGHCFWRGTAYDEYWRASGSNSNPTPQARMADFGGKSSWNKDVGTVNAGDDNANHGDLSLVNLSTENKSAGDSIWVSNDTKRYVTSREAPAVGDPVCRAGTTDFQLCGLTISAVNVNHTYGDGTSVKQGDLATLGGQPSCAEPGDSGGPVYRRVGDNNATAVGIVSGTFTVSDYGCALVFTGVEEAIQAWGGGLNLH